MASPANAAVRENRRQTTPLELERMNVSKALTAAEHSRRQFILNFAATRNTQLLIPGRKSDAVKVAEEWAAVRLRQNGHPVVKDEFFRYTVDARLWETHGRPHNVPSAAHSCTRNLSLPVLQLGTTSIFRLPSWVGHSSHPKATAQRPTTSAQTVSPPLWMPRRSRPAKETSSPRWPHLPSPQPLLSSVLRGSRPSRGSSQPPQHRSAAGRDRLRIPRPTEPHSGIGVCP